MKPYRLTFPVLLSIAWLCVPSVWASPAKVLTGQITDQKGQPVPYAELYLPDLQLGTTTDRDGRFRLSYDPGKATQLRILHSAYETVRVDLDTLTLDHLVLPLKPRTYHFDPITVEGNLYGRGSLSLPVTHRVIPLAQTPAWGNSVGERLDRSGIQIKDYGGPAGLKTVASPTGHGEHILVMLDGLPLNSPQHGGFDFTMLPADILKQVEFYPGHGSSLYGSNAVGGTLNLLPYNNQLLSVQLKTGSFGEAGISGWIPLTVGNLNVSLFGNGFRSEGEFPFTPPGQEPGQTGMRENNRFNQNVFALGAAHPLGKQWKGTYLGLGTGTSRGVAGSVQYPSDSARKVNDDRIHLFAIRGISGLGKSEIHLGMVDTYEHYTDPVWGVDSEHALSSWILRGIQRFPEGKVFQNSVILEARNQFIDSDDAGTHRITRTALGGLSQLRLLSNLQMSMTFRGEWSGDRGSPIATGSLGLLWKPPPAFVNSVIANLGTSYRNPTFNDLYWQDPSGFTSGNPELLSERGRSAHVGIEAIVPTLPGMTIEGVAYHYLTGNLIQWTPDENFVFSPENLSAGESYGLTLTARVHPSSQPSPRGLAGLPLKLSLTTNQNVSRVLGDDPNRYDELLYVPRVSHWLELEYLFDGVTITASYRYLGRQRYSYVDDPEAGSPFLVPYQRLDASVTLIGPRFLKVSTRLVLGVRNLQDRKDQESVFGYPEPARALFARLALQVE